MCRRNETGRMARVIASSAEFGLEEGDGFGVGEGGAGVFGVGVGGVETVDRGEGVGGGDREGDDDAEASVADAFGGGADVRHDGDEAGVDRFGEGV